MIDRGKWKGLAAGGAMAAAIAAAFIAPWEGQENKAYWDSMGQVWTICSGHTAGVQKGDVATDEECLAFLQEDLKAAEAAVARCITVSLKENERAAFIEAAFNIGPSVVCGSTLQRLANAGDVMGACLQLTDAANRKGNNVGWTSAGGKEIPGLRNRRTSSRNLCLGYYK